MRSRLFDLHSAQYECVRYNPVGFMFARDRTHENIDCGFGNTEESATGAGSRDEPAVTVTIRPRESAPARNGCASIARSAGRARLYAVSTYAPRLVRKSSTVESISGPMRGLLPASEASASILPKRSTQTAIAASALAGSARSAS